MRRNVMGGGQVGYRNVMGGGQVGWLQECVLYRRRVGGLRRCRPGRERWALEMSWEECRWAKDMSMGGGQVGYEDVNLRKRNVMGGGQLGYRDVSSREYRWLQSACIVEGVERCLQKEGRQTTKLSKERVGGQKLYRYVWSRWATEMKQWCIEVCIYS